MAILSFTRAKNIKAKSKALAHGGVPNLWLLPSSCENGVGSWVFRFKDPMTKKQAKTTIGRFPAMSLAEAADEARRLNDAVRRGQDPRYVPKNSTNLTLEKLIEHYKKMRIQTGAWSSPATVSTFDAQLANAITKPLGLCLANSILPAHLAECLLPIWQSKPAAAAAALQQVSAVFSWAVDMGLLERDVTRQVRRALGKPKSNRPVDEQHQPAMHWQEVPTFVRDLMSGRKSASCAVLLFVILTACRVSAARLMSPSELDLERKIWRVPANSVGRKTSILRVNPLSDQAIDLIHRSGSLKGQFVFSSSRYASNNKALALDAITQFIRNRAAGYESDIDGRHPTVHGFRSTFKQWADVHGYDDRWSELQLWHNIGNRVHRAYAREQLVEQRREMMQSWADYCFALVDDVQAA